MTFDHDFCYFILLFSFLLKKEGREKENEVAKIVIKNHTFLFHPIEDLGIDFFGKKGLNEASLHSTCIFDIFSAIYKERACLELSTSLI